VLCRCAGSNNGGKILKVTFPNRRTLVPRKGVCVTPDPSSSAGFGSQALKAPDVVVIRTGGL
jgi:hypothetical protein